MSLQTHSELTLTIEKPVAGGRMLARHEGQIVFVAGAIPGERVRVRVERVDKQLAFANAIEILEPSADRRSTNADWACGGSFYAHITYERQLGLKSDVVEDAFARIAKMRLPRAVRVAASDEQGYRMRARLHVQDRRFGFFREGTHDLCDAGQTRQLLPATIDVLRRLETELQSTHVTSCDLSENSAATERAVLLELAPSATAPNDISPIDGLSGLLFIDHVQGHVTVSHGSPYVTDRIAVGAAEVSLTHHVQSFFQGNRYLLSELVARVLAHVPGGMVTDLYAGVGLFAISLAARGDAKVLAIEGDRSSARDLESNAEPFGTALHVEHLSVESHLKRRGLQRPDTVLLDPPRTGISQEAMSGLLGLKAPRFVYVSCDPATLARDVRRFTEAGYHLDHIEAFDLFPNTAHVETLAVLTHGSGT